LPLLLTVVLLRLGVGLLIVLISVVGGAVTLVLSLLLAGLALSSELLLPSISALSATAIGLLESSLVASVVVAGFKAALAVVVGVSSFHLKSYEGLVRNVVGSYLLLMLYK
jgi:hypothetical protein